MRVEAPAEKGNGETPASSLFFLCSACEPSSLSSNQGIAFHGHLC